MKKVLSFLTIVFSLVACDQSIESTLKNQAKENKDVTTLAENTKRQTAQTEKVESNLADKKIEIVSENKATLIESKDSKKVSENLKTETDDIRTTEISNEPELTKQTEKIKEKVVDKQVVDSTNKIISPPSNKKVKGVKVSTKSSRVKSKAKKSSYAKGVIPQITEEQKIMATKKVPERAQNDGTYEHGQLVSNFSSEELRLGYQRTLTQTEIQYYKSLCRYAYMSEQDIIDNRCEAKRVKFTR